MDVQQHGRRDVGRAGDELHGRKLGQPEHHPDECNDLLDMACWDVPLEPWDGRQQRPFFGQQLWARGDRPQRAAVPSLSCMDEHEHGGAVMRAVILAVVLLAGLAQARNGQRLFREMARYEVGGAADGHWEDPYSLNAIGTVFLLDWPTNTIASRGSIGSGWDAGAVGGVGTAGNIQNKPSVATGPVWTNVGTNSFGEVQYGWFFDRSDDQMNITNRAEYSLTDGARDIPFTIYGWVNKNTTSAGGVIGKMDFTKYEYFVAVSGTSAEFYRYANGNNSTNSRSWTGAGTFPTNQWVFMTIVHTGGSGNVSWYTNAVGISSSYTDTGGYTTMTNKGSGLTVGNLSSRYGGLLAYFGIIKTNLTPTEVTNLWLGVGGAGGPGKSIRKRVPASAYP